VVFTTLGWAVLEQHGAAETNSARARGHRQKHRRRADDEICFAARNHRPAADRRDDRRGHHRFERRIRNPKTKTPGGNHDLRSKVACSNFRALLFAIGLPVRSRGGTPFSCSSASN
jgi:hypothetical protein